MELLCDGYTRGRQPLKGDQLFWQYFHAFYLNLNCLPLSVAYRMAVEKMRSAAPGAALPTLSQARYDVANMDLMTVIMAREGETAARNMCVDFIQRDWSEVPAGYCIIGDSRTFDTRVRVFDDAAQKWRAVRPSIAALIDSRSWYFAAYWITTEPVNTYTLINTLALYCAQTGGQAPAVAYFDNGKDYCAKGFSTPLTVEGNEHSIFKELGIRLQNSSPYNGRAKTIERAFRDMMQNFDKMFPDYLGSTPAGRNAAADWFDHHAEELPSLEQFCTLFDQYISAFHSTPKNGKIHGGKSPAELWEQREVRPAMSAEQLHFAFLKPEDTRTVTRGPAVSFNNTLYYSDAVSVGEKVLVKSDHIDPTHVYLFTIDGRLKGEARTRDAIKALADEDSQEQLKALIARQRKQLAEARTTIRNLTGGMEQVSPIELMLAPIDAKPRLLGTKQSVKGPAHTFRRMAIPGVITAPQLDFQEDAKAQQLADFGETVASKETEEPSSSKEALSSFNEFMTSRHRDDDF
ncbi:MAG: transposase [Lentisphaeria bacterium]|nr:transposase [Lentisphaeria bacterium]